MPVSVSHHYSEKIIKLPEKKIRRIALWFARELGVSELNINILFTDDTEIQHFNHKYRNKNSPTNVLSFPFSKNELEGFENLHFEELGDILISLDTAQKEAKHLNQTLIQRISWLVVHGMLHLLGFDHEKSAEEAENMRCKELQLLDKLNNYRSYNMTQLAINVDHVATIRQARGINEPDPVTAASICEIAGASGIVVHLREDRRHIQDRDVYLLRRTVKTKLNLEMGSNKEIIDIALDVGPDMITLVPEKRQELTTEGGLDVVSQKKKLEKVIKRFRKEGIPVSLFVDPDHKQIRASSEIGAYFVEIHTGRYCDAVTEKDQDKEFQLIASAAEEAYHLGLAVNGGHGLNYKNARKIAALDTIDELSIGHAIIARSVFTGLDQAVRDMLKIIHSAQLQ